MSDTKTKKIIFYHLTSDPLERPLADLAMKLYEKGERTLIVCENENQMRDINNMLWTFSTKKFIPHGSIEDSYPEQQPILISYNTEHVENKPSTVVMLSPIRITSDLANFSQYIYMFCSNDSDQNAIKMNDLYEEYKKSSAHELKYWSLNTDKKWVLH